MSVWGLMLISTFTRLMLAVCSLQCGPKARFIHTHIQFWSAVHSSWRLSNTFLSERIHKENSALWMRSCMLRPLTSSQCSLCWSNATSNTSALKKTGLQQPLKATEHYVSQVALHPFNLRYIYCMSRDATSAGFIRQRVSRLIAARPTQTPECSPPSWTRRHFWNVCPAPLWTCFSSLQSYLNFMEGIAGDKIQLVAKYVI